MTQVPSLAQKLPRAEGLVKKQKAKKKKKKKVHTPFILVGPQSHGYLLTPMNGSFGSLVTQKKQQRDYPLHCLHFLLPPSIFVSVICYLFFFFLHFSGEFLYFYGFAASLLVSLYLSFYV